MSCNLFGTARAAAMSCNVAVVVAMLSIGAVLAFVPVVRAQDSSVPPNILPPPPPAPPPPKIEVPKIPKADEMSPSPKAALSRRGSFGDRVRECIEEAAAAGLGPNERAAYSRACANR